MIALIPHLALFTLLPILIGAAIVLFDRTANSPLRRAEAFLVPLFLVGVGGGGITGFIANVLIAEAGNPFQRELGFAHLAIGLMGAFAVERRDGFREATVGAAAVFGFGIAIVRFMDSAAAGSLASAETLLHLAALAVPVLLVWFLVALRRAELTEDANILLRGWMIPVRRGSVAAVAIAAAAFSLGYPTGLNLLLALAGVAASLVAFWWIVGRAPTHRVRAAN